MARKNISLSESNDVLFANISYVQKAKKYVVEFELEGKRYSTIMDVDKEASESEFVSLFKTHVQTIEKKGARTYQSNTSEKFTSLNNTTIGDYR